jgi:hypothetical protein
MGGTCSTLRVKTNMYRVSVGKPEGKRSLRRLRHTRECNIKMDLKE